MGESKYMLRRPPPKTEAERLFETAERILRKTRRELAEVRKLLEYEDDNPEAKRYDREALQEDRKALQRKIREFYRIRTNAEAKINVERERRPLTVERADCKKENDDNKTNPDTSK